MKIIVKDAQEAIEVADVLSHAARSVEYDANVYDIDKDRIEEVRDYLYTYREKIEVNR